MSKAIEKAMAGINWITDVVLDLFKNKDPYLDGIDWALKQINAGAHPFELVCMVEMCNTPSMTEGAKAFNRGVIEAVHYQTGVFYEGY